MEELDREQTESTRSSTELKIEASLRAHQGELPEIRAETSKEAGKTHRTTSMQCVYDKIK
ncbi:hypothetical protein C0J52_04291 [Blattella germanica]|nr:hypothetical protein C0J52_04291 [Blattella germanica]